MPTAVPQSPAASSRLRAGAEGERIGAPVLIRIPDLHPAPVEPAPIETSLVEPAPKETAATKVELRESFAPVAQVAEKKPAPVAKPPFRQAVSRKPQPSALSPMAVLVGVALVGCVLAAMLVRNESSSEAEESQSQDPPGLIAAGEAPADELRLSYNLDEPVNLRAAVPAPTETTAEPAVMPWPRQPASDGGAASTSNGETTSPTDNSQIGTMYQPAFEARQPAATVEFEGTITKPEFRSHYERY